MQIADQRTIQQCLCFRPEFIPGFPFALCIGDQRSHQFQDIFFRMNIGERIVMHRLFKIDRIHNLNPIPILQKRIPAFHSDASFRISNHIGTVHLKEIRLQPEPCFS